MLWLDKKEVSKTTIFCDFEVNLIKIKYAKQI